MVAMIVAGLYLLSPLALIGTTVSPIISVLGNPIYTFIYGGLYALTGMVGVFGIFTRNYELRTHTTWLAAALRFYNVSGTIYTLGFFPLTWLPNMVVVLILLVLYYQNKGFARVIKHGA